MEVFVDSVSLSRYNNRHNHKEAEHGFRFVSPLTAEPAIAFHAI